MNQLQAVPEDGSLLDYTLEEKLGQGGMGEVFLAFSNRDGNRVAIKFLVAGQTANEIELRQRFAREVRLLSQFDHPNIVRILDQGIDGNRPYLVMEYVRGGNLRGAMKPGVLLPLARVRELLGAIGTALATLEAQQIVHRDLKPENVLLGEKGEIKVSDFGISAAVTEVGQLTSTAQTLGTLDYMAPEQRFQLPVDSRADQYSLGVIVYELLTGRRPLGNFKPPSQLNSRLHLSVDAAVLRALQEDPDDRYDRIPDFARDLDAALGRRPSRRWGFRSLVAALVGIALGTIGFSVTTSREQEPVRKIETPEANSVAATDSKARAKYYFDLAEKHFLAGRDKPAELCYTEAIRLDPTDPLPYLKRAFLYKKSNVYQKALEDLEAVLRLDPDRLEALIGKGSIYVQLLDFQLALPVLNRAVEIEPNSAEALAWRGRTYYKLGQEDLARDDLDLSTNLDGNLGIGFMFRSLIHYTEKNFVQTRRDLESAIRCMPDNHYAHAKLSDLFAQCPDKSLQNLPQAIHHAKIACELTQWQSWDELRILGRAYAANEKLAEAIEAIEKAIPLAPALDQQKMQKQLSTYRERLQRKKPSP